MNTKIQTLIAVSILSVATVACTAVPDRSSAAVSYGVCGDRFSPGHGLELSIARDLHQQGRSRSALAHLEVLSLPYPDAKLLQADALRLTGKLDASDEIYQGLSTSCLSASAYRGRALNAVERKQVRQALALMTQARQASPTDADIRNDLGYLMMLDGNPTAAAEEFLTALELNQNHANAAQNLVLLYLQRGQQADAYRAAETYGVHAASLSALANTIER